MKRTKQTRNKTKLEVPYRVTDYQYQVGWSEDDQVYVARVTEFPSLGAHGSTLEKALKEIQVVVKETLKWMAEEGEDIPEPLSKRVYSGKLLLRMNPSVHRQLAEQAIREGTSLNELINAKLI